MGKARRCRSVVIGAGVAVLGTVGACPPANAAVRHGTPRRRPGHVPHAYVYKFQLAENGNDMHADCGGPLPVIRHALLRPASANTTSMLGTPKAEDAEHAITVGTAAKLHVVGSLAGDVHSVCAIDNPLGSDANAVVEPGVFTWRLSRPARTIAEVIAHPATEAEVIAYDT